MTHVVAVVRPDERSASRHLAARGFFVALVLAMTGVVLAGFWPFYAGLVSGGRGAHGLIYLHAAVFSGWMVLLFTQVVLIARRRVAAHQRLGRLGIYYGLLVLLMGLVVTFAAPVLSVRQGARTIDEAAGFLILPLGDMLLFAGFFGAGIAYRRTRVLHSRLMLLATIALLFAPAARLGRGLIEILLIWLFPLALAIGYDVVTRRRVERVYLVGLAVLLVAFARIALVESEAWLVVGRRIMLALLATP